MPQHVFAQIAAGAAIAAGLFILATPKGTISHRIAGRVFSIFALLACMAGVVRYGAFLSVVMIAALYQLLSGWHLIYRKARGPNWIDLLLLFCVVPLALLFVPVADLAGPGELQSPWLFYWSFYLLLVVIVYDNARWFFPPRWAAAVWPYEHMVKMVGGLSGMVSALFIDSDRFLYTWLHLTPAVASVIAIGWFAWRLSRRPLPVIREDD